MNDKRNKLRNLKSIEFQHPFDRKALQALKNTAGLPKLIEFVNKHSIDRVIKVNHTGSYLLANEEQYSRIYKIYEKACSILDIKIKPKLYIKEGYVINAYATCYSYPIITLFTGTIDKLTDEELGFIIGHELGHIKCKHLLYKDVANKMSIISRIITDATFGFGGILTTGLEVALLYWSRMAEYSCDRAGLLVCQDFDVASKTIIKMAGGTLEKESDINYEGFKNQVKEFEGYDYDSLDKASKIFSVLDDTHPWTVMRASELQKWYDDGSYEKIVERKRTNKRNYVCKVCGRQNKIHSKFCSNCGEKF